MQTSVAGLKTASEKYLNFVSATSKLEVEMWKVARVGKLEEVSFADEARTWAGVCVSEKLPRNGNFILAYRDPSGASLEPSIIVDNKDKATITEGDIRKLIRDVKERGSPVGIIVAREESQLRQLDRERRWGQEDGVFSRPPLPKNKWRTKKRRTTTTRPQGQSRQFCLNRPTGSPLHSLHEE